jgi:hypothetical protein
MATVPDRALYNDHAAAPGEWNLAKKVFESEVMRNFFERTQIWDLAVKKPFTGAKTEEFICIADDGVAQAHEPGSDIVGQQIEKLARNISLEDREAITYYNVTSLDRFIQHYDLQVQAGINAGNSLAKLVENHTIRQIALAAQASAVGAFLGGQLLTTPRTASTTGIKEAYPLSLTGSRNLQDDIGEICQKYREDKVTGEKYVFVGPYLHRVLRQDNTLLSRDYVDSAYSDKITGKLLKVEDCWVLETMYMPTAAQEGVPYTSVTGANWSADTEYSINGTAAYQVDLRKLAAVVVIRGCVGALVAENISTEVEKIPGTRSWNIGVAMLKGMGILRPELAGAIFTA